jgi:hypothetical protein
VGVTADRHAAHSPFVRHSTSQGHALVVVRLLTCAPSPGPTVFGNLTASPPRCESADISAVIHTAHLGHPTAMLKEWPWPPEDHTVFKWPAVNLQAVTRTPPMHSQLRSTSLGGMKPPFQPNVR